MKLKSSSEQIGFKTKNNRDLVIRVYPRLTL